MAGGRAVTLARPPARDGFPASCAAAICAETNIVRLGSAMIHLCALISWRAPCQRRGPILIYQKVVRTNGEERQGASHDKFTIAIYEGEKPGANCKVELGSCCALNRRFLPALVPSIACNPWPNDRRPEIISFSGCAPPCLPSVH